MEARTFSAILLFILQVLLLQSVQALNVHERRSQDIMSLNGIAWHESCNSPNPQNNQETKRAAVERAWAGALELSSSAWTRFETVTWPTIRQTELNSIAQHHINIHDPGYVLLFALDSSEDGREEIESILNNLHMRANANLGENNRPIDGYIQIRCSDVYVLRGTDECEDASAATESYEHQNTGVINFCPDFWKRPRFDQLKSGDPMQVLEFYHNPDYAGTDAKTVVHELSHIWWIGDTNSHVPEVYGLVNCAEEAWMCDDPVPDNRHVVQNADTYAFYAEFGYWVEKGIHNLWPPTERNPVRFPVRNY
ncbi:Glucan endo-1-3-alpha-glucosidase agn1 [Penicillium riverlandense]|uniref:Glucan endo-1-3-alpha-glucosidase agn1 n=1 Tax=Penicillium riverlandense TaxID=1903569 RepID=UPI0025468BCF|nr:Glucan endo-1-3-alpha-glucosidase agn1 [Penicillium riverlandense]KAJ5820367.1 Glucan endo-1-3-alpha-glucosidase agn1 [Penicillium riverlandense]